MFKGYTNVVRSTTWLYIVVLFKRRYSHCSGLKLRPICGKGLHLDCTNRTEIALTGFELVKPDGDRKNRMGSFKQYAAHATYVGSPRTLF